MNLWIRSQDKETLTKPMDLQIINVNNSNEYAIISFTEMAGDITLGFYNSKERAVEVLNDIQNIVNAKTIIKFYNGELEIDYKNSIVELPSYEIKEMAGVIVYEMPKE